MESLSSVKPGLSQAKLDDLLQCSICLDPFTRPKVLPCQHTYCQSCLMSTVNAGDKIITCPQCRKGHSIPANGVRGLPDNLVINNLLGLREENSIGISTVKDLYAETVLCLDCQNGPSVSSCDHCSQKLCSPCLVKHAKLSTQIEGSISDLRDTLTFERRKCSDHMKTSFGMMYTEQEKIDEGFDRIIEEVEKRRQQFHGYFCMLEMLYQDVLDDWLTLQVRLESGEAMDTSDEVKGADFARNSDEKSHLIILDFEKIIRETKTCADLESVKLKIMDMKTAIKLIREGEVIKFVWEGVELGRLARLEVGQSIVKIEGHYDEADAEHSGQKWKQIDARSSENKRTNEVEMNAEPNNVQKRPAAETSNQNRSYQLSNGGVGVANPLLKVGARVRVKPSVSSPRYRWAGVTPSRVGTIRNIVRDELEVDFPGSIWPGNWKGTVSEIDVVDGTSDEGQNKNANAVEPKPGPSSAMITNNMDIGKGSTEGVKVKLPSSCTRQNEPVHPSSSSERLKIGNLVRVKQTVSKPVRGWGNITHACVGVVVSVFEGGKVVVNFPENKNWNGFEDEMELVLEPNSSNGSLKVGDIVRVKADVSEPRGKWGQISHSSVGKIRANQEGKLKVDFPEQSDWNGFEDEMERVLEPNSSNGSRMKVGDIVRVKADVSEPRGNWGQISHSSVGKVRANQEGKLKVDFPEQSDWNGFEDEMELIPDLVPLEPITPINVEPKTELKVGDLVRVKRSVSKPFYGWGTRISHASVGTVVCVVKSSVAVGETVKVDFPERGGWYWTGLVDEMEVVKT